MGMAQEYAELWDRSSRSYYKQSYYNWMSEQVDWANTVLELGCGVGYSTLALAEVVDSIISVDSNDACLAKTSSLLDTYGLSDKAVVVKGDITDSAFKAALLSEHEFDAVVCWNPGTYYDHEVLLRYTPLMLEYGLTVDQIKQSPASSYVELILWHAGIIAVRRGVPFNIVDRCDGNHGTDQLMAYYRSLGSALGYNRIAVDTRNASSFDADGKGVPMLYGGIEIAGDGHGLFVSVTLL